MPLLPLSAILAHLALAVVWPILVILALREMGAPVELSARTYVAALVLIVSVKAAKKGGAS